MLLLSVDTNSINVKQIKQLKSKGINKPDGFTPFPFAGAAANPLEAEGKAAKLPLLFTPLPLP